MQHLRTIQIIFGMKNLKSQINKFLIRTACFLGFHDLEDCDDCEGNVLYITTRCTRCGKIKNI